MPHVELPEEAGPRFLRLLQAQVSDWRGRPQGTVGPDGFAESELHAADLEHTLAQVGDGRDTRHLQSTVLGFVDRIDAHQPGNNWTTKLRSEAELLPVAPVSLRSRGPR